MPDYIKRVPAVTPRFTAHRYEFGEPVDGELLDLIRRGAVDAQAVEVPQWRSLLIKASRDAVLVADGTWLVYEHDRGYLTTWTDDEFTAEFTKTSRSVPERSAASGPGWPRETPPSGARYIYGAGREWVQDADGRAWIEADGLWYPSFPETLEGDRGPKR